MKHIGWYAGGQFLRAHDDQDLERMKGLGWVQVWMREEDSELLPSPLGEDGGNQHELDGQ